MIELRWWRVMIVVVLVGALVYIAQLEVKEHPYSGRLRLEPSCFENGTEVVAANNIYVCDVNVECRGYVGRILIAGNMFKCEDDLLLSFVDSDRVLITNNRISHNIEFIFVRNFRLNEHTTYGDESFDGHTKDKINSTYLTGSVLTAPINSTGSIFTIEVDDSNTSGLAAAYDDNIRGITWTYNYAGKQWKYFTMYGATCHEIDCNVTGAYCLECEGLE